MSNPNDTSGLAVRRAPLPCFRPFVIVNAETNEVVGHYKTEAEANTDLQRMLVGAKRATASKIQPTGDPIKELEARMKNPFGETREPSTIPGGLGRRKIEL